jgi:hypothetical protein
VWLLERNSVTTLGDGFRLAIGSITGEVVRRAGHDRSFSLAHYDEGLAFV